MIGFWWKEGIVLNAKTDMFVVSDAICDIEPLLEGVRGESERSKKSNGRRVDLLEALRSLSGLSSFRPGT